MTGVRQGGVKGCSDRTGCQTMNAAKNGSQKKETLIFNSDSYWICCMYGFSGLSSILGNISLAFGNNSLAAV